MGRPALDPTYKATRLADAKLKAARLNKRTPPNVYACATAHGRVLIRYEPPAGRKVTLTSPFPSIEFDAELLRLRMGMPHPAKRSFQKKSEGNAANRGTLRWLCFAYFESRKFRQYTARDQRVRRGVLIRACEAPLKRDEQNGPRFGEMPVQEFGTKHVKHLRERFSNEQVVVDPMYPSDRSKDRLRSTSPEAGNSTVRYLRGLLEWALDEHVDLIGGKNWAKEVKLNRPGKGHLTWQKEQCDKFEATHPVGTTQRLIYDLARLTGQRRGDLARLGPSMIRANNAGERVVFVQEKGRETRPVPISLPICPELRKILDTAKENGLSSEAAFIAQKNGERYTSESLGNMFGDACKAAGIFGYSLHGLRKTNVVELVKYGCNSHEVMAITGHSTMKEVDRYSREYDRAVLADQAFAKRTSQRS